MRLVDIASAQQSIIANTQNRGAAGGLTKSHTLARLANTKSNVLQQGKYSVDSNPLTPPWVQMPDGGFPFSSNGTINTPAATGGPPYTWTDVIGPNGQYVMQVPNGSDGVIRRLVCFYNGGGFISGSGALVWRILVNGQAVRNYDNILVQLGVQPFPGETEGIRVFSGQTVQFQVTNVSQAGGGTQIFCFFGGWYWPNKLSSGK